MSTGGTPEALPDDSRNPEWTLTVLAEPARLKRILRSVPDGQSSSLVARLSMYLPAVEEPDPAYGRWHPPQGAGLLSELLRTGHAPQDLRDYAADLTRTSPHRVTGFLARQMRAVGLECDLNRAAGARANWRRSIAAAARADLDGVILPSARTDEVVREAARWAGRAGRQDGWLRLIAAADQFTIQRTAAAAADRAEVDILAPILATCPVWDLEALVQRLHSRSGDRGQTCRRLVEKVEQVQQKTPEPLTAAATLRARNLLDAVAWTKLAARQEKVADRSGEPEGRSTAGVYEAVHEGRDDGPLGTGFWLNRPARCYRGSDLLEDLYEKMARDLMCSQEAADIALALDLSEGTVSDVHRTAEGILA